MYIVVDTSWLYNRYYYVNKDKGHKDPAIYGVCYFLELLYRDIDRYKEVYFVLDTSRANHDKSSGFDGYKEGRADKSDLLKNFDDFLKILSKYPKVKILKNMYREADDVISALSYTLSKKGRVIVYSGDKDLLQLKSLSDDIHISNSYKGGDFVLLKREEIFEKIFKQANKKIKVFTPENTPYSNLLKYRVFRGDASDNIKPPIPRITDVDISKIFSVWEEDYLDDAVLGDIIIRLDGEEVLKHKIAGAFEEILKIYNLVNLTHSHKDKKVLGHTKKVSTGIDNSTFISLLEEYKLDRYKNFVLLNEVGV
jgi:5'-3' exonuclease